MNDSADATPGRSAIDTDRIARIDAYWRACNYLAAGMIYLQDG